MQPSQTAPPYPRTTLLATLTQMSAPQKLQTSRWQPSGGAPAQQTSQAAAATHMHSLTVNHRLLSHGGARAPAASMNAHCTTQPATTDTNAHTHTHHNQQPSWICPAAYRAVSHSRGSSRVSSARLQAGGQLPLPGGHVRWMQLQSPLLRRPPRSSSPPAGVTPALLHDDTVPAVQSLAHLQDSGAAAEPATWFQQAGLQAGIVADQQSVLVASAADGCLRRWVIAQLDTQRYRAAGAARCARSRRRKPKGAGAS